MGKVILGVLLLALVLGVVKAVALTYLLAWLLPSLIVFSFKSVALVFAILFVLTTKFDFNAQKG